MAETSGVEAGDLSAQQLAAMVHAVWLVLAADKEPEPAEMAYLVQILVDLTDGEAPDEAIDELFRSYEQMLADHGVAGSITVLADVLREPAQRAAALQLAVGAVRIDGQLAPEEQSTLLLLATAFGYSDRRAHALLAQAEVIGQKPLNRCRSAPCRGRARRATGAPPARPRPRAWCAGRPRGSGAPRSGGRGRRGPCRPRAASRGRRGAG
ncbi:MAG: TerB family tellurite resistance protein [Myxococcales bacterium]|nr:MAG: TerB family tellurite resistance protein [Myxococcales bacterium]